MLHWARYHALGVAPLAFFLTTCVHAPVEKVGTPAAGTTEQSSNGGEIPKEIRGEVASQPRPLPTAPTLEVASSELPRTPIRSAPWSESLAPVHVYNTNTEVETDIRLYAADGTVDEEQIGVFDQTVAAKGTPPPHMSPRLIQLVMKAAYHFDAHSVVVVSAYRPSRARRPSGKHATAEAI